MRNLLLALMLTGTVSCYAAEAVIDPAALARKATLVTTELQKLSKSSKTPQPGEELNRLSVMQANLEKLTDPVRLALGRDLKIVLPCIEGFDAEKDSIMASLQPLVDGVDACMQYLGFSDYEVRITALDAPAKLTFAQDFTAYKDLLEGNAMRKLKIAAICNKILESQREKDRLTARQRATSVRSEDSLKRFATAAGNHGNDQLAKSTMEEARKIAAELMGVESHTSPSVIAVVTTQHDDTQRIAEERRLKDEARKKAFRDRLARMANCFAGDKTVQSAAKSVAQEQAAKEREEKLAMLRPKLVEATTHFDQAQETRAQASARADQEAAALALAKEKLPPLSMKIPADQLPTIKTEVEPWFPKIDGTGTVVTQPEGMTIIAGLGLSESSSTDILEAKVTELMNAKQYRDGYVVLRFLARKYRGTAESSESMLVRAKSQEAEAEGILRTLEADVSAFDSVANAPR